MFNDMSVVTTAVSSFNNAALYCPYFFVAALFSVPLFIMAFLYGKDFISKFGWSGADIESKTSFWGLLSLVFWMLLVGGNYSVIRDSVSLLPTMIAIVLFVSMIFITNWLKKMNYCRKLYNNRSRWGIFVIFLILAVISAMPTWWGILLQLSAVLCGIIVGDRLHRKPSDFLIPVVVFCMMTSLLLMQPEYFRFGQLGNLTFIHIIALLFTGFFCATAFATKYTKARSRIYNSAYIKLKWLFRIMALLALILFVLTESVPVFLGLMAACMLSEMLTIYHSKSIPEYLFKQSWALVLISFGIIIICPVISMLGIIYLSFISSKVNFKDFLKLL